eukprot:13451201-Heterocapsa_arctica.AAC.1
MSSLNYNPLFSSKRPATIAKVVVVELDVAVHVSSTSQARASDLHLDLHPPKVIFTTVRLLHLHDFSLS